MSAISTFITKIRTAVYGEQVRGAIADAIEQCYDDVSSPALNTAAFATAIANAYADGFLDIQEKSTIAGMTNTKIIYRYTGNETGYVHNALYYHDGTAWKPIGSGVQVASAAAQMTDTKTIYLYVGTETGYTKNVLYYYNGTEWTPIADTSLREYVDTMVYVESIRSESNLPVSGTLAAYISNRTIYGVISDDCRIAYYKISPNALYSISKDVSSSVCTVGFTSSVPELNATVLSQVSKGSGYTGTFQVLSPNNANYLCIYYAYNDANAEDVLNSITVSVPASVPVKYVASQNEQDVNILFQAFGVKKIDFTKDATVSNLIITDNNASYIAYQQGESYVVPLGDTKKLLIKGNNERTSVYAWLKDISNFSSGQAPHYAGEESTKKIIASGDVKELDVPSDAAFLFVQKKYCSGDNCAPEFLLTVADKEGTTSTSGNNGWEVNSVGFMSDSSGRDVPMFVGVLNAYKKAMQFKNIEWTALKTVPTDSSATGISANSEHVGMLYSEALEYEKYVGFGCSIKTFMTALHNPYSVMYTEDTKGTPARKKSAYGFNYSNTTLNGAFYGTVCSGFTSFALGLPVIFQTYDINWLTKKGVFAEVYDNSANGARLMDIIWKDGHVQLVTDIYRDSRGKPTSIHVSESVHDVVVTNVLTPNQFDNYLETNNGKLYRCLDLYKNTEYQPSEFVAVEDEVIGTEYQYNDDICTYLGDYVSIADWEKMFINYAKGSYTNMEIYKGNTRIENLTLPNSYNDTHSIDITSYLDGAGEYKVRLTGDNIESDYTYFEVVESVVSTTYANGVLNVTFSSSNGEPVCVKLKTESGGVKATRMFTDLEKAIGSCNFSPISLISEQGRSAPTSTIYARVFFNGKYNQVIGDYVDSCIY